MALGEGWGCLFAEAFGIEGTVGEKIISTSFGGVAGHGERAPGAAHARTAGASAARPLLEADRVPHGV
jgi:hypothetical protein